MRVGSLHCVVVEVGQLEVGAIPSDHPIKIKCQGSHGGILEYILGDRPWEEAQ